MKSRRTLQNLVSLKGRALSIVNKSKLNHKGPLHSGQIFQLAVKSYLWLTRCDGRKWYVVTIVETAALLLLAAVSMMMQRQVVVNRRKPALRNNKLLEGSGCLQFREGMAGMDALDKHVVTFGEHGQPGGWQHFQPTVVKSSIIKIHHCFAAVTWKHRRSEYSLTSPGDHNSATKPSASLYRTGFFCSCNEGMGMMRP